MVLKLKYKAVFLSCGIVPILVFKVSTHTGSHDEWMKWFFFAMQNYNGLTVECHSGYAYETKSTIKKSVSRIYTKHIMIDKLIILLGISSNNKLK